jgi:hypothetical protein
MKKLIYLLGFLLPFAVNAQRMYNTQITGISGQSLNAKVWVAENVDTTQPVKFLLFSVGAGEQGTNAALINSHGPFQYLQAGKPIGVQLVIAAVQNINQNPRPEEVKAWIVAFQKRYKVKAIVLTGLSRGGQNTETYANDSVNADWSILKGLIVFSSQGSYTGFNAQIFKTHNCPIYRGVGTNDFTWDINNNAQKTLGSTAQWLNYFGIWQGAGHGDPVWSDGYSLTPVATTAAMFGGRTLYQIADSLMGGTPITITYKNAAISATYTRNNCTCSTGSTVTYTVPAGKYTSTISQAAADALASTDMTTNGQVYANSTGSCVTYVIASMQLPNGTTFYLFSDGSGAVK